MCVFVFVSACRISLWVETLEDGWNTLVAFDSEKIKRHLQTWVRPANQPRTVFGDGNAALQIVKLLDNH